MVLKMGIVYARNVVHDDNSSTKNTKSVSDGSVFDRSTISENAPDLELSEINLSKQNVPVSDTEIVPTSKSTYFTLPSLPSLFTINYPISFRLPYLTSFVFNFSSIQTKSLELDEWVLV